MKMRSKAHRETRVHDSITPGRRAAGHGRLKLDQTTILGNRELPKVTFVVPWRDIESAAPDWPLERLVDEPLTPLDREAHRLKMEQTGQLKAHDGQ